MAGTEALGKVYGLSGARLRQLRERGAPIESPDQLHSWLEEHGVRISSLAILLLDGVTRRDLHRKIQSLNHPR